ncbi:MAG: RagB/SusD family nutrient uptake outer membrane protein [Edaphocola sp.]
MKLNNKLAILVTSVVLVATAVGCKKDYLDTETQATVTPDQLYSTTDKLYDILTGLNNKLTSFPASLGSTSRHNDFGQKAIDLADDAAGDDLICAANDYDWFSGWYQYYFRNQSYAVARIPWAFYYQIINNANAIIAYVDGATGADADKKDLKGEAYAYRAFAYSRLLTYYSKFSDGTNPGLPIYTEPTESAAQASAPRSTVQEVKDLILSDFALSVAALSDGATTHTDDKNFISLAVAQGLYARAALMFEDYTTAADMADKAITNSGASLMDSATYCAGFNDVTNVEWMWGSTLNESQTAEMGIVNFISFVDAQTSAGYAGAGGTYRAITTDLYNKIPSADVRKKTFYKSGTYWYQSKFRLADQSIWYYNNLYMRLAEMYLIKAEALAHSSEASAITTLESLVQVRNPNYSYSSTPYFSGTVPSGSSLLLEEVYLQRRIELFLEGFRYSDIRRQKRALARVTGSGNHNLANSVIQSIEADSWDFLFMIPIQELDANPQMGPEDQNP